MTKLELLLNKAGEEEPTLLESIAPLEPLLTYGLTDDQGETVKVVSVFARPNESPSTSASVEIVYAPKDAEMAKDELTLVQGEGVVINGLCSVIGHPKGVLYYNKNGENRNRFEISPYD